MKKLFTSAVSIVALISVSSAVQAADPAPIASTYDWSGFYAGANIGVSSLDPNILVLVQPKSSGIMGGGQVGYNFQIDNLVFGLEGDFSATDLNKSRPCTNPTWTCNAGADWTASVRARVGWAADRFLIFGTGGVAFLDYNGYTQSPVPVRFPDSKTFTGWTAGGGIEYGWTDNIIFGAEASYAQFPRKIMAYDIPYSVKPDLFTARVRASFKF